MVAICSCGGNNPPLSSAREKPCLPKAVVIVLTLLSTLVLAGGVGGGVYAFMHQVVPAAAAGGGTLVVAGALSLIIVKCCTKQKEPIGPSSKKSVSIDMHTLQAFAQHPEAIPEESLAPFLDPSSGQPLSRLQLYQRLLIITPSSHANYKKTLDRFIDAFYDKLLHIDTEDEDAFYKEATSYLSFLDISIFSAIGDHIFKKLGQLQDQDARRPLLTTMGNSLNSVFRHVTLIAESFDEDIPAAFHELTLQLLWQIEIQKQLTPSEVMGSAHAGAMGFYQTIAQALSVALKRQISVKDVARELLSYLGQNEQTSSEMLGQTKYQKLKARLDSLGQGRVDNKDKPHPIECVFLSEVYGVSFQVIEASTDGWKLDSVPWKKRLEREKKVESIDYYTAHGYENAQKVKLVFFKDLDYNVLILEKLI